MNSFKKYFIFVIILFVVLVIFSYIYNRSFSGIYKVLAYYAFIGSVIFCIDLIKKRKVKWLILLMLFFMPMTYLIFAGINAPDYSSLDVLETSSKFNVPFLPDMLYCFKNRVVLVIGFYILYFILPFLYFYGVYFLSKRLAKWK